MDKTSMDAPFHYNNNEAGAWACGYEDGFRAGMRAAGDVAYLYLIEEYTHELGADVQNAILAEANK